MRVGRQVSAELPVSTGAPQGCCLSPKLFTLYTHDCVSTQDSTTILGLISRGRLQENNKWHPVLWGGKEPQPQHRKNPPKRNHSRLQEESCPLQPLTIKGAEVEKADNRTFPGQLTSDLSQTLKTPATVGRATTQQGLQWIRLLRKAELVRALWPGPIKNCYVGVSPQATACNTTKTKKKAFQRAVKTAEKITRSQLPSVDSVYMQRPPTNPALPYSDTDNIGDSILTHNTWYFNRSFQDTRTKWSALCAIQNFPSQYLSLRTTFSSEIYFICVPSS